MEERKMTGKSRIYVAGHRGMVGQALVSLLEKTRIWRRLLPGLRIDLNLLIKNQESFFAQEKNRRSLSGCREGGWNCSE